MIVIELFAGIGAQRQALKDLGIEHEAIVCEIDPHAYRAYCAIHGDTPNLGDITKVERLPPCDLLTYSFPCQDLSQAGNKKGMSRDAGTRSSLLWEVERLLRIAQDNDELPDCLLMENVDAILNRKNLGDFREWVSILSSMGYRSAYRVLNAKDFGIPQNRRRCFMISRRDGGSLDFPEPEPLTTRLKDYLEEDVPDSFFLSEERMATYERHRSKHGEGDDFDIQYSGIFKDVTYKSRAVVYGVEGVSPTVTCGGHGCGYIPKIDIKLHQVGCLKDKVYESAGRVYDPEGISPTICTTSQGWPKIEWPAATKKGHMIAGEGDGLVIERPYAARSTVQSDSAPTLTCGRGCGVGTLDGKTVRFLTPLECWRLMGFPDQAYTAAERESTPNQLYKMAGNSIVVPVLRAIFSKMYRARQTQRSLMDF